MTPELNGIRTLALYYWSYYKWYGNMNIRNWEMRRAKVAILLAGVCYRMQRKVRS